MTKQIKTWEERCTLSTTARGERVFMQAEIDELRAALAQTEQPMQGGVGYAVEFAELKKHLSEKTEDWLDHNSWNGDTEGGFYTTNEVDLEKLFLCIDEFGAQLRERSALPQSKPAEPINQMSCQKCYDTGEVTVYGIEEQWQEKCVDCSVAQAQPELMATEGIGNEPEILAEYTGFNGHRQWVNVGAWLYPGDCVAVLSPQPAVQLREGCTQYVEAAQPTKREPLSDDFRCADCPSPHSCIKAGNCTRITKGQQ